MSRLVELQTVVAAELRRDALLQNITVLTEQLHDLSAQIEKSITELGIGIFVRTPVCEIQYPNLPGPQLQVPVVVQVFENVLLNQSETGTRIPALAAAEAILRRLHQWPAPLDPATLLVGDKAVIVLVPDDDLLLYNVNFTTDLNLISQ